MLRRHVPEPSREAILKLSPGEVAVIRSEIADLGEKARQTRAGAVFSTGVVAIALFLGLVIGGWTLLLPLVLGVLLPSAWRRDHKVRREIARRELRLEASEGVERPSLRRVLEDTSDLDEAARRSTDVS